MKTGRPNYHIPSAETLSRDVKQVFVEVRKRISQMLKVLCFRFTFHVTRLYSPIYPQEYNGALNFAVDAWTSPNHKAYVAFTVHFEHKGDLISMLLDLAEVPRSHSGVNLAEAFANIFVRLVIIYKGPLLDLVYINHRITLEIVSCSYSHSVYNYTLLRV